MDLNIYHKLIKSENNAYKHMKLVNNGLFVWLYPNKKHINKSELIGFTGVKYPVLTESRPF